VEGEEYGKNDNFAKPGHIDQLAQLGYTDTQIAVEVGWKVWTVRKWRRRAQRDGRKGMASKMGRPAIGALSSYPSRLREALRAWRIAHPGWGPKTLRTELEADESFKGQRLPSLPVGHCELLEGTRLDAPL
jgi:transposase-like protein